MNRIAARGSARGRGRSTTSSASGQHGGCRRTTRRALKLLAGVVREGTSERARRRGQAYIWGETRRDDERAVSRLRTPDPYVVTVAAAVVATERVLDGAAPDGFQTPAGAFGPEFVLDLDGVSGFFDEERPERKSGPLPWR